MSEFTCCKCNTTYKKNNNENWNSFKAAEEFLILYPEAKNDPTDILCDDCNEDFKNWFATLMDDEKKQMREDYHNEV